MNEQAIITCNAELQHKQAIIHLLIDDTFRQQAGYCKAIRENREMLYIIFNYNGSHAELVVKLARQIEQKLYELLPPKNLPHHKKL